MDARAKLLIEKYIDLIEINRWDELKKKIGPKNFSLVLPVLAEAGIWPILALRDISNEAIDELCSHWLGNSGFVGFFAGEIWDNSFDGQGFVELNAKEIMLVAKDIGFDIYETTKSPYSAMPDWVCLSPDSSVQEFIDDFHEDMGVEEGYSGYFTADDFKKVN